MCRRQDNVLGNERSTARGNPASGGSGACHYPCKPWVPRGLLDGSPPHDSRHFLQLVGGSLVRARFVLSFGLGASPPRVGFVGRCCRCSFPSQLRRSRARGNCQNGSNYKERPRPPRLAHPCGNPLGFYPISQNHFVSLPFSFELLPNDCILCLLCSIPPVIFSLCVDKVLSNANQ